MSLSFNLLPLMFLLSTTVEAFLMVPPISIWSFATDTYTPSPPSTPRSAFEMGRSTSTFLLPSPPSAPKQPLYYKDYDHMEHMLQPSDEAHTQLSLDVPRPYWRGQDLLVEESPTNRHSNSYGNPQPRLYCDLDGVLVDFCQGISEAFDTQLDSQNIDALPRNLLWKMVQQKQGFFEHLSWCHGGRKLWEAIAPLRPTILTGVPSYCHRAPRDEKFAWCIRELSAERLVGFKLIDKAGPLRQHRPVRRLMKLVQPTLPQTNDPEKEAWCCDVITCWSEHKHHECQPGDILIDDRLDLRRSWEAAGGVFIHHRTGDTENTLEQLQQHGVLPSHQKTVWH